MKIDYKTSSELHGAFLIDRDSLAKLHKIVTKRSKALRAVKSREIRRAKDKERAEYEERFSVLYNDIEEVNKKVQSYMEDWSVPYSLSRDNVEWKVELESGVELITTDITELFSNERIKGERVTHIHLSVEIGKYDGTLKIGSSILRDLDISVRPRRHIESSRFFNDLSEWAEENRLSPLFSVWHVVTKHFPPGFIPIVILMLFFPALLPFLPTARSEIEVNNRSFELRERLESLVEGGVTDDSINTAIEALLERSLVDGELATERKHFDHAKSQISPVAIVFLCIMAPLWIISFFPPRTTIGLGIGERKIMRIRRFIKVANYVIPTLALGVISSYLVNLLM